MPTARLYYTDDYQVEFEAAILSIDSSSKSIVLDRTAFYPTGGHQHSDFGRIGKGRKDYAVVTDVHNGDDGTILHHYEYLAGKLQAGDRVKGEIDWTRRYHLMRLHTAQHLFSRLALRELGAETGKADFSERCGLIVMDRAFSMVQLAFLEELVNETIRNALPVRREIDPEGRITLHIEGLDKNACGGTHVRNTSEIGEFKINRVAQKNLYYDIGEHARRAAHRLANESLLAANLLGLDDVDQMVPALEALISKRQELDTALAESNAQLTDFRFQKSHAESRVAGDGTRLLGIDLSHLSVKSAKKLVKPKLQEGQVWLCLAEKRNLVILSSSDGIHAGRIMKGLVERWSMKGGGNAWVASGGAVPDSVGDPLSEIKAHILAAETHPGSENGRIQGHNSR